MCPCKNNEFTRQKNFRKLELAVFHRVIHTRNSYQKILFYFYEEINTRIEVEF
jgi:hypothetical protein